MTGAIRQHGSAVSLPLLPVLLGGGLDLTSDWRVPDGFLAVCAQVVSVLVLAVAVETRLLSIRDTLDRGMRATTVSIAVFLAAGQLLPIVGLLVDRDLLVFAVPGVCAIAMGLAVVLAAAVLEPLGARSATRRAELTLSSASLVARAAQHAHPRDGSARPGTSAQQDLAGLR